MARSNGRSTFYGGLYYVPLISYWVILSATHARVPATVSYRTGPNWGNESGFIMKSNIQIGSTVSFPAWTGERIYMQEFHKNAPLPVQYARWQSTVDQMLGGIDTNGPVYLMVDQALVKGGQPHRRPGVHVDGHWVINAHGGSGHGSRHGPVPYPRHQPGPLHQGSSAQGEALVLASDVEACAAYVGEYERDFVADWRGGDCSDLDLSQLNRVDLYPNHVYIGDVFTLHESLPVQHDCRRTLVRLNVCL